MTPLPCHNSSLHARRTTANYNHPFRLRHRLDPVFPFPAHRRVDRTGHTLTTLIEGESLNALHTAYAGNNLVKPSSSCLVEQVRVGDQASAYGYKISFSFLKDPLSHLQVQSAHCDHRHVDRFLDLFSHRYQKARRV